MTNNKSFMSIWREDTEKIREAKKNAVRAYLKENEVSPTAAGYNVLLYVIIKASEEPNFSCRQLFDSYAKEVLKKDGQSKTAYKNANYAIKHSASKSKSTFRFIKDCSVSLE